MIDVTPLLHNVKPTGDGQGTARCPGHEDRENSLSYKILPDRILLHCHAGCSLETVVSALGIQTSDLFEKLDTPPQKAEIRRHTYEYRDASGKLLYRRPRIDYDDQSKNTWFEKPDGTKGMKGVQRVPYNLPAVTAAQTVYFVEGEKCADALIKAGRVATTLDGGANSKWLPEYTAYFEGKTVIILPDNDKPGMKYANTIKTNIPSAKIVTLPGLKDKEDIYDWLNAGHTLAELDALPEYVPPKKTSTPKDPAEPRVTPSDVLLKLVDDMGADFFHDDLNIAYAVIPVNGHREIWPIDNRSFKTWLHGLYYKQTKRTVSGDYVAQAVSTLSHKAQFDAPEPVTLSTRVTEHGGAYWYDLTNTAWQAASVTPEGWRVVDKPPIIFNRYPHQAAQVMPQPGGDVKKILKYVNLKDHQTLFLCWLVACFVPDIPHPMPILYGEKGAAKSTACALLKRTIDPSKLDTLTLQNDQKTLVINMLQHWFSPFDNVSHISGETSDFLCRSITGAGIQNRKLFSDADDVVFSFKRCLAINGINNVATRADLLDRSLLIELERITDSRRRELNEVMTAFEADRASILGGILDTLSAAMRIYPKSKPPSLPRMADFSRWGYAIAEALGGLGDTFLKEYEEDRANQNTEAINSDPVALLTVEYMRVQGRYKWEGTVTELFAALKDFAPAHGINTHDKAFPSQPNGLSRRLNGIRSNLEAAGISMDKRHTMLGNFVILNRL